ncbi:hypothetical protein ACU686_26540 [Yinghuangia aomiensis]
MSGPVPNRGSGCRVYIEVLLTGAAAADDYAVDTRPARRARGGARRALPG